MVMALERAVLCLMLMQLLQPQLLLTPLFLIRTMELHLVQYVGMGVVKGGEEGGV